MPPSGSTSNLILPALSCAGPCATFVTASAMPLTPLLSRSVASLLKSKGGMKRTNSTGATNVPGTASGAKPHSPKVPVKGDMVFS